MNEVIEKARRLLQLRERAATPGEAQAAARALAKMLDKHRISIAELEMQGNREVEPLLADVDDPLICYNRLAAWKNRLIHVLCKHYGVACWRRGKIRGRAYDGRRKMAYAMHLCGRKSDMDMVRHMLAWLSTEVERLSRQECEGLGTVSHNSWRRGFVDGLDKQLRMARDDVAEHSSDAALVLRKRLDDANDFLDRAIEDLKKGRKVYRRFWHDPEAHAAGKRRGESQHLGDKIDAGHCRALPSGSPP